MLFTKMKVVQFNMFIIAMVCANLLIDNDAEASSLVSASVDLCGSEPEVRLTKSGETASMTVTLNSVENRGVCKLRVLAPKTHVVNMEFVETIGAELRRALKLNHSNHNRQPCMMNVFLPENPGMPVWKGDPCSDDPLPDIDLLTPDFKIIWNPPTNASQINGKKFIITAIGQGTTCKEPGQHTCMKIGWEPLLCVSKQLLCDGNRNCPSSATNSDEDEKLCQKDTNSEPTLEQLAVEILKNLEPTGGNSAADKWLRDHLSRQLDVNTKPPKPTPKKTYGNWRKWQERKPTPKSTTTTAAPEETPQKIKTMETLSAALARYGPWGYLVLGIVICAIVLMFCGLYECCFKRPKNTATPIDPCQSPRTTAVLIINGDDTASLPPNYDDLDQPPSYSTLFPNCKNPDHRSEAGGASVAGNSSDSSSNSGDFVECTCMVDAVSDISSLEDAEAMGEGAKKKNYACGSPGDATDDSDSDDATVHPEGGVGKGNRNGVGEGAQRREPSPKTNVYDLTRQSYSRNDHVDYGGVIDEAHNAQSMPSISSHRGSKPYDLGPSEMPAVPNAHCFLDHKQQTLPKTDDLFFPKVHTNNSDHISGASSVQWSDAQSQLFPEYDHQTMPKPTASSVLCGDSPSQTVPEYSHQIMPNANNLHLSREHINYMDNGDCMNGAASLQLIDSFPEYRHQMAPKSDDLHFSSEHNYMGNGDYMNRASSVQWSDAQSPAIPEINQHIMLARADDLHPSRYHLNCIDHGDCISEASGVHYQQEAVHADPMCMGRTDFYDSVGCAAMDNAASNWRASRTECPGDNIQTMHEGQFGQPNWPQTDNTSWIRET